MNVRVKSIIRTESTSVEANVRETYKKSKKYIQLTNSKTERKKEQNAKKKMK